MTLQHIHPLIDICLLRRGPQDLPVSQTLRTWALGFYVLVGLASGIINQTIEVTVQGTLLDLLLLVGLTTLALWLRRCTDRTSQTLTALAGSGVILETISLPLLTLYPLTSADFRAIIELALFGILTWHIVVYSHILRHALSIPYIIGVVLTILYAIGMIFLMTMIGGRPGYA